MKKLITVTLIIVFAVCMSFSNASAGRSGHQTAEGVFIITSAAVLGTALIYSLNSRDDYHHHRKNIHYGKRDHRKYHQNWKADKRYDRRNGYSHGNAHGSKHAKKGYPHYGDNRYRGYDGSGNGRHKNRSHEKKYYGHYGKNSHREINSNK